MLQNFTIVVRELQRTFSDAFNSYRPELYYMRGPGPACRAKAAPKASLRQYCAPRDDFQLPQARQSSHLTRLTSRQAHVWIGDADATEAALCQTPPAKFVTDYSARDPGNCNGLPP
jgi:hypothetical protein